MAISSPTRPGPLPAEPATSLPPDGIGYRVKRTLLGKPLRVVVFQAPGERTPDTGEEMFDHTAPLTVLVNPVIEVVDPTPDGGWEGCLSVPGLRGFVERPGHIRYRGYDTNGTHLTVPAVRLTIGFDIGRQLPYSGRELLTI